MAMSQTVTHWTKSLGGTEHATTKLGARFHLRKLFLRRLELSTDELEFVVTYLTHETTLADQSWWRTLSHVERLETASRMQLHHLRRDEEQVLWLTSMEAKRDYVLLYGNAEAKPVDPSAAPVLRFPEGSVVGNLSAPTRSITVESSTGSSSGETSGSAAAATALAADLASSGSGSVSDSKWRRLKREKALRNALHLYNRIVIQGPADYLVLTASDVRETVSGASDRVERDSWAKLFGLERFAGCLRQTVFEPGAFIAREGQSLGALYLLVEGDCRASVARDDSNVSVVANVASKKRLKPTTAEELLRHTHQFRWSDASQLPVASLGPRSCVGDISLALGLAEPTTVQAVTYVSAVSLSLEDFTRESDKRDPAVVACVEKLQSAAYDTLRFVLERVEAEAKHEHCDQRLKIDALREALRLKQSAGAKQTTVGAGRSSPVTGNRTNVASPSLESQRTRPLASSTATAPSAAESSKAVSLPSVVLKHAAAYNSTRDGSDSAGHRRAYCKAALCSSVTGIAGDDVVAAGADAGVAEGNSPESPVRLTRQQRKAARAFASLHFPVAAQSLGERVKLAKKPGDVDSMPTDLVANSPTTRTRSEEARSDNLLFLFPTMTRQRQLHGKTLPLLPRYRGYDTIQNE